jgi:hypothetical protein
MIVKIEKLIEMKNSRYEKCFLLIIFFSLFFSYSSISQKIFRDAKKVKDNADAPFIILKTGEKVNVKKIKSDYNGSFKKIVFFKDKKVKEEDIIAFQNSKGYFKKFSDLKPKIESIKHCYLIWGREIGSYNGVFFLRHKKGVVNVYGREVGSPNVPADRSNPFYYQLNVFENENTKEVILGSSYCYDGDSEMSIVENWVSNCGEAKKLIYDCKHEKNFKISKKLNQFPILEAIDMYNEEFKKKL